MSDQSAKHEDLVDRIMTCAYLAATGNAHLADEQKSALEQFRANALQMVEARKAIEHFETSGNLDEALKLYPFSEVLHHDMSKFALFGDIPTYLTELHERRHSLRNIEELLELEKEVASAIEEEYFQKVAVEICLNVCGAGGSVSSGEASSIGNLCAHWGLDLEAVLSWLADVARPVIGAAEQQTVTEEIHPEIQSWVTESIDLMMKGEELDLGGLEALLEGIDEDAAESLAAQAAAEFEKQLELRIELENDKSPSSK